MNDPLVKIEHCNLHSPFLLEKLISGSDYVIYFTHEYFSNTLDKNKQLLDTVEICKSFNIKRIVAVCPIEYINYYNNDGFTVDPLNVETDTHDEAMYSII